MGWFNIFKNENFKVKTNFPDADFWIRRVHGDREKVGEVLDKFHKGYIGVKVLATDKFDPKLHQAMFEGPSETVEKGNIMQVIYIGFSIGDRLLRASHVAVSSGSPKQKPCEDSIEKS